MTPGRSDRRLRRLLLPVPSGATPVSRCSRVVEVVVVAVAVAVAGAALVVFIASSWR